MRKAQVRAYLAFLCITMSFGSLLPVVAGLGIGITMVIFSLHSVTAAGNLGSTISKNGQVVMTITNLKDAYRTNEPISFSVMTKGVSGNLCNFPEPSLSIVSLDDGRGFWYNPPTFQTAMRCDTLQGIDTEWRFGYEGEKLPYRSALRFDQKYDNHIAIEKPGLYAIIATFDDSTIEKVITVISSDSGMSVSNSQLPEGTFLEVNVTDSDYNPEY